MTTETEWAWVAGIVEGEGCLHVPADRKGAGRIHVKMTDHDVVERLHQLIGMGRIRAGTTQKVEWKPCLCWEVAYRNDVLFILQNIKPWLGARRTKQADALAEYVTARRDIRHRRTQEHKAQVKRRWAERNKERIRERMRLYYIRCKAARCA